LLYLAGPTVMFIMARLSFPRATKTQDLDQYYTDVSERLWYFAGVFFAITIVFNIVLLDVPLMSAGPISQAILCIFSIACANTSRSYIHVTGLIALIIQLVWRGWSHILGTVVHTTPLA